MKFLKSFRFQTLCLESEAKSEIVVYRKHEQKTAVYENNRYRPTRDFKEVRTRNECIFIDVNLQICSNGIPL